MPLARFFLLPFIIQSLVYPTFAQQIAPSNQQPELLLRKSLTALVRSGPVTDVTLTGSARRIAGSDDETGTVVLKAISNGSARLDFTFFSGSQSEISNLFVGPTGCWFGPDGVSHATAFHNLLTEPAWFFPALAVARRLSSSSYTATDVGSETLNGEAVERISVSQIAAFPNPTGGATFEHLSQVDFLLDSATLLPAAIEFNIHPDDNALLDIPIQILFSDYRAVSGIQVPFHTKKFLNNTLLLDLQIQNATINSGVPADSFTIQ